MRTSPRVPGLLLCLVAAACDPVTSSNPDADAAVLDARVADAREVDAGDAGPTAPSLRVFHTARHGDNGANLLGLYATDVETGVVVPAVEVSDPVVTPAVQNLRMAVSASGQLAMFTAQDANDGKYVLHVARLGAGGPGPTQRLSKDHGPNPDGSAGGLFTSILAPDGTSAIYGWGKSLFFGFDEQQYYFVDLTGPTPASPVPLGTGGGARVGTLSPDGSKFAFSEKGAVFVVYLDGAQASAAVKIGAPAPRDGATVAAISFSSSSQRLAYTVDSTTAESFEVFISDVSGATPGQAVKASGPLVAGGSVLASTAFQIAAARFSPDGKKLAYLADASKDEVYELFMVDVSGAIPSVARKVNDVLVEGGSVVQSMPVFSDDGRKIVYAADQRVDGVTELFVTDVSLPTPGTPQRVNGALVPGGNVSFFVIAPGSKGVAYTADQRTDEVLELFYVDLSGASPSQPRLVSGDMVGEGDVREISVANVGLIPAVFSPDGKKLVYAADQLVDGRIEVFFASIAGGTPAPATRVQASENPVSDVSDVAFSADGKSLVYASNSLTVDSDVWWVDVSGAAPAPALKLNSRPGASFFLLAR